MPLNKFGTHFLDSDPSVFYIWNPSGYFSKCVITIRGRKDQRLSKTKYTLDNHSTAYTFPVSGKVENIQCYPNPLYVTYKSNDDTIHKLLESNVVNKGDTIEFNYHSLGSMVDDIYIEFTIQCPLVKNE